MMMHDLLATAYRNENAKDLVKRIKLRKLPKRCLVIMNDCIQDDESRSNWSNFKKDIVDAGKWSSRKIKEPESRLAGIAGT